MPALLEQLETLARRFEAGQITAPQRDAAEDRLRDRAVAGLPREANPQSRAPEGTTGEELVAARALRDSMRSGQWENPPASPIGPWVSFARAAAAPLLARIDQLQAELMEGACRERDLHDRVAEMASALGAAVQLIVAREREAASASAAHLRALSDQERFNIASRRSLVEQSDRYLAERDALAVEIEALRADPAAVPGGPIAADAAVLGFLSWLDEQGDLPDFRMRLSPYEVVRRAREALAALGELDRPAR